MPTHRLATALTLVGLWLAGGSLARAQDAPSDDALDKLLEKVEGKPSRTPDAPKADVKKDDKPKADAPRPEAKKDEKPKADPKDRKTDPARPADGKGKGDTSRGESPDESLDKLLEGIGETTDQPEAKGKPMPGGGDEPPADIPPMPGGGGDKPQQPEDVNAGKLKGGEQQLDERLEEILGRKNRKKNQQQGGEGGQGGGPSDPSDGPLGETIKKMDQVERKLGEKDTGEKTREEQQQIVDGLKQLIKQAQQQGGQGKGQRTRTIQQAENQGNGQQQGQQGNTGSGTGPQKPKRPDGKTVLAENKDEWGHLPPELRGEMENVFKEEPLPRRKSLIDRYYISINKKSVNRGGQ